MKSVLLVSPVAPWGLFGGTATVSRNLIELFSKGLAATVCCLRCNESGNFPRMIHGATVLSGHVSEWSRKLKFFLDFSNESFAYRQFDCTAVRRRFAALLAEQRPECVIFDHIYAAWLVDLVDNPATRVAYIAHDDMVVYADSLLRLCTEPVQRLRFARLRRQYHALQEKILHRCNFVLSMTAADAVRLGKSTRAPVEVAPLFFEFPKFTREYPADFRYLLVTGSFDTWEKQFGLTHFLRTIFKPLLQGRPELQLVIAGRVPPAVRQQIRFTESQVRIVHGPSDAEMQTLVEQASAGVVLDLQVSGLKIKTIDLAAAGLPLISWEPGIEGSHLVHGESCLCANSPEEFSNYLDRLCTDSVLRKKLGTAARAIVQAEFSRSAADVRLKNSKLYSSFSGSGRTTSGKP